MSAVIYITVDGVSEAVAYLEKFAEDLEPKLDRMCKELAEIGRNEAQQRYSAYSGPDGNSVTVTPPIKLHGGGYEVRAQGATLVDTETLTPIGNEVVFEEFGSGSMAGAHELASQFEDIRPKSWSESEYGKHMYASLGWWKYKGHHLYFIKPTRAMYLAARTMISKAIEVARKVFK